jgi:hypothetical protein
VTIYILWESILIIANTHCCTFQKYYGQKEAVWMNNRGNMLHEGRYNQITGNTGAPGGVRDRRS